jgi:hypothetical protein
MANFKLTAVQQVVVSANGVDAKGNPAPLEGFKVTSSDEAIATASEVDGSWVITALKPGFTQIDATADARIGEGETLLQAEPVTLEVIAAEAVTFSLQFGEPTEQ